MQLRVIADELLARRSARPTTISSAMQLRHAFARFAAQAPSTAKCAKPSSGTPDRRAALLETRRNSGEARVRAGIVLVATRRAGYTNPTDQFVPYLDRNAATNCCDARNLF
jgi:hypothetical protein